MNDDFCNVCGKQLKEETKNSCPICGANVCPEDYDTTTGYCTTCSDNSQFCGC